MGETSLLIFSFCLQAAIGTMIFITIGKHLYKGKAFKKAALVTAGLSVVGILASLSHLGQPLSFLNSLSNLGSSWLSAEALLSGFFMGIAVLYALVLYFKPDNQSLDSALRWAGCVVGLIAVFSMAKVYTTTVVPVWQGMNTFVDFYATTIAIGVLIFIAASLKELGSIDKKVYGFVVLAAVAIQAAVAIPHAIGLGQEGMAAQASAAILNGMSVAIGLKWLLILGGAGVLMWPTTQNNEATGTTTGIIYAACAALVVGQFIGRYVFYAAMIVTNVGLS